jgi:adenosylmethionine-8-amino-7-oxononanoate aminotransferase
VATASIDRLLASDWQGRIHHLEGRLEDGLFPLATLPTVKEVRVLGAIGVVEMRRPVNMARVQRQFVDRGVWIRPFGRLVYTMPPYIISDPDLDTLTRVIGEVVAAQ